MNPKYENLFFFIAGVVFSLAFRLVVDITSQQDCKSFETVPPAPIEEVIREQRNV